MSLRNAIGVDIGGGSIKVSLFEETGKELKSLVSPTPEHLDNQSFLEILKDTIRPLVADAIGIGVGSPGPLNNEQGIMISSANLQGLKNLPIGEELKKNFLYLFGMKMMRTALPLVRSTSVFIKIQNHNSSLLLEPVWVVVL